MWEEGLKEKNVRKGREVREPSRNYRVGSYDSFCRSRGPPAFRLDAEQSDDTHGDVGHRIDSLPSSLAHITTARGDGDADTYPKVLHFRFEPHRTVSHNLHRPIVVRGSCTTARPLCDMDPITNVVSGWSPQSKLY